MRGGAARWPHIALVVLSVATNFSSCLRYGDEDDLDAALAAIDSTDGGSDDSSDEEAEQWGAEEVNPDAAESRTGLLELPVEMVDDRGSDLNSLMDGVGMLESLSPLPGSTDYDSAVASQAATPMDAAVGKREEFGSLTDDDVDPLDPAMLDEVLSAEDAVLLGEDTSGSKAALQVPMSSLQENSGSLAVQEDDTSWLFELDDRDDLLPKKGSGTSDIESSSADSSTVGGTASEATGQDGVSQFQLQAPSNRSSISVSSSNSSSNISSSSSNSSSSSSSSNSSRCPGTCYQAKKEQLSQMLWLRGKRFYLRWPAVCGMRSS